MVIDTHIRPALFSPICENKERFEKRCDQMNYHLMKPSSIELLKKQYALAGIEKVFLLPSDCSFETGEPDISNDEIEKIVQCDPTFFVGFASADPRKESAAEELEKAFKFQNLAGLYINTARLHMYPCDERLFVLYDICKKYKRPIIFQAGLSMENNSLAKYCRPIEFEEVLSKYPEVNICLSHVGWPWVQETAALLLKYENCYTNTALMNFDGPYQISNVSVSGTENGAVIKASGQVEITEGESILAGGFISEAEGVQIADSHVTNLKAVYAEAAKDNKEGYAGGFVGRSHTGGLAGLAQEDKDGALKLPGIVNVSGLLDLVPYLIPQYTNTTVTFCSANEEPQVKADYAGGFFGEMQSGKVDNSTRTEAYAVYGLEKVKGESHAGGFAGKVDAGATASSNGLNLLGGILNLDIGQLLDVLQVYIPIIQSAGVKSTEKGFTVEATDTDSYAGGYLGYGGGVQIKDSDVTSLKHTKVTPPGDSLESANGDSYFGTNSQYAVKGGKYAGGYAGCVDIDSAAAVGGGLKLLGNIELTNLLKDLSDISERVVRSIWTI